MYKYRKKSDKGRDIDLSYTVGICLFEILNISESGLCITKCLPIFSAMSVCIYIIYYLFSVRICTSPTSFIHSIESSEKLQLISHRKRGKFRNISSLEIN